MGKEEAQIQLQDALTNTFLTNLVFLSEYDNELYHRVEGLSKSIQSKEYEVRFNLEFLEEKGEFDIYDIYYKRYLYNKDPKKFNNRAKKLDFSSNGSFSNISKASYQGIKTSIDYNIEDSMSLKDTIAIVSNELSNYIDIFNDKIDTYKDKKYKYFSKFIIIGTLLGRHIPSIHNKFKSDCYFVCEPNLEIFRLSLFVFDYTALIRDNGLLFFSIMDDKHIFNKKIKIFIEYKNYENYCIKYFTTDYGIEEEFENIANSFVGTSPFSFNYRQMLNTLVNNTTNNISKKYKFLQFKKNYTSVFTKPVLLIAPGPSLEEDINFVIKNRDKFIIVCVAAAFKKLIKHKINPDIITTVDNKYIEVNEQFNFKNNAGYLKDTIIIASSMTSEHTLSMFKKENIYLCETSTRFYNYNGGTSGYSVGETSVFWLLSLGCSELYLLGLDLAINQKTGQTHISESQHKTHNIKDKIKSSFVERGHFSLQDDIVSVKGNFHNSVFTSRIFMISINSLMNILDYFPNEKIFNLSKGGAYFKNTIPFDTNNEKLHLESIEIGTIKNIIHSLDEMSLNELPVNDLQELTNEDLVLDELLISIDKLTLSNNLKEQSFQKEITQIINKFNFSISKFFNSELVLNNFFGIVIEYIFYCLNDNDIKKENKKIEESLKLFKKHISDLIYEYKFYINRIKK